MNDALGGAVWRSQIAVGRPPNQLRAGMPTNDVVHPPGAAIKYVAHLRTLWSFKRRPTAFDVATIRRRRENHQQSSQRRSTPQPRTEIARRSSAQPILPRSSRPRIDVRHRSFADIVVFVHCKKATSAPRRAFRPKGCRGLGTKRSRGLGHWQTFGAAMFRGGVVQKRCFRHKSDGSPPIEVFPMIELFVEPNEDSFLGANPALDQGDVGGIWGGRSIK